MFNPLKIMKLMLSQTLERNKLVIDNEKSKR